MNYFDIMNGYFPHLFVVKIGILCEIYQKMKKRPGKANLEKRETGG